MAAALGTHIGSAHFESWSNPNNSVRSFSVTAGQGLLCAMHAQFPTAPTITDNQGNTWHAVVSGGQVDGGAANTKLFAWYCPSVSATGTLTVTCNWGSTTAPQGTWDFAPIAGHNVGAGSAGVQAIAVGSAGVPASGVALSGSVTFADWLGVCLLGINATGTSRGPTVPAGFTRVEAHLNTNNTTQLDWSAKSFTSSGAASINPTVTDTSGHSGLAALAFAIQSAVTSVSLVVPTDADWVGATGLVVDWWPPAGPTAAYATRVTGLSCVSDGAGGGKIVIPNPTGLTVGHTPTAVVQGTPTTGDDSGVLCGGGGYIQCSVV